MTTIPLTIPLARPAIGDAELEGQARALRSGRLVLGPENAAFEEDLARVTGAAGAVAVASGTAALHAALWALGLPAGAQVIVPAFTFPAPAHAAAALGLEVVAAYVDPDTWNLSPAAAAAAAGPRTACVIVVDQFGHVAEPPALDVPVLEDAACALGAADSRGRAAGTLGVLGCFSFHPRKIVTTGEGGAVVGRDAALLAEVRALRHHGQRAAGEFGRVGLNFRMPEACAAVGRAQVARLPALLEERARLVARYRDALDAAGLGGLRGQRVPAGARPAWQTFALLLDEGTDRARVIARLRDREIEAGPATYALHRIGSLKLAGRYPVADALHDRALALPLWNGMTGEHVGRVVSALREALA
jgi:dTDP-4-amino-4,6-dideoxygalactose transaminase